MNEDVNTWPFMNFLFSCSFAVPMRTSALPGVPKDEMAKTQPHWFLRCRFLRLKIKLIEGMNGGE